MGKLTVFEQKNHLGVNAAAEAEQQRAIAETQASMMIAKRFPRDPVEAIDRILNACTRQGLAEEALYSYSRGGTDISGVSIHLAKAVAQNWGNIQHGIRELSQSNGESTVEAFAWDLETNTKEVKIFQVPHVRYSKAKGYTKLEDPRDIYELIANNGARRLRACILGVIPGDVVENARKQCESTLASKADTSPEAVKKMVEAFAAFGITPEMIKIRIQRQLDSINPAQIIQLRKIYNSLKDGMSKPGDWFDMKASEVTPEKKPIGGKLDAFTGEVTEPSDSTSSPLKTHISQDEERPEPTGNIKVGTTSDGKADWQTFGDALREQVIAAPDKEAIVKLEKKYETQLKNMQRDAPDTYSFVQKTIELYKSTFSNQKEKQ